MQPSFIINPFVQSGKLLYRTSLVTCIKSYSALEQHARFFRVKRPFVIVSKSLQIQFLSKIIENMKNFSMRFRYCYPVIYSTVPFYYIYSNNIDM